MPRWYIVSIAPQNAAPFGDAVEFHQDGFFDKIGEFFDDEGTLQWVLVFGHAEFVVDDHLDGHGATNGFLRGRSDCFVVGVGVQRVAVVVDGVERLQGGADVVEADFLRVQGTAACLDVVL